MGRTGEPKLEGAAGSATDRWTMTARQTDEEFKDSRKMRVDLRLTHQERQLGAWREKVFTIKITEDSGDVVQETLVLSPEGWDGGNYVYKGSGYYNYTLWVGDFGDGPECQLHAEGRIIGWTQLRFWAQGCQH